MRSIFLFLVLAEADHNNMDAPSKQGLKERWRTRRCIPSEFKRFSGRHAPALPYNFLGVTAEYPATSKLYPWKSWMRGYAVSVDPSLSQEMVSIFLGGYAETQ